MHEQCLYVCIPMDGNLIYYDAIIFEYNNFIQFMLLVSTCLNFGDNITFEMKDYGE